VGNGKKNVMEMMAIYYEQKEGNNKKINNNKS